MEHLDGLEDCAAGNEGGAYQKPIAFRQTSGPGATSCSGAFDSTNGCLNGFLRMA